MTITEALAAIRAAAPENPTFSVQLACSFTPLHLKTLLAAHLQKLMPERRVLITEGTFGDLAGTIERASGQAVAVAIEWQDLDRRLAYREGGDWGRSLQEDLLATARQMLGRIEQAIAALPEHTAVAISLPTLPMLPVFSGPTRSAHPLEMALDGELSGFAARLSGRKQLQIVSRQWLADKSPYTSRLDLKSELLVGFPYSLPHADALSSVLARQLAPRQPLKGVITDLDNTFWSGLVGEVGAESVRWDGATRYYLHGLYQKLLSALADEGVLIGIASKNDPKVVTEALKRQDLLLRTDKVFPIEVHWAPKSESVTHILKTWNISADAVAFVDDTPLELAEVAATHPGITAVQFPVGDYNAVREMLERLRDLCSKRQVSAEDALRLESIRKGAQFSEGAASAGTGDDFLRSVQAKIVFDFEVAPGNPRPLELVNKTNQFNVNGARLNEAEWQEKAARSGAFLATVNYEDKFGPLGVIGVVAGQDNGDVLDVDIWVMSCRAFSRRIEHQTLKKLFERFGVRSIRLHFAPTAKNGPTAEFFASVTGQTPTGPLELTRSEFEAHCPALYHQVEETTGVPVNG